MPIRASSRAAAACRGQAFADRLADHGVIVQLGASFRSAPSDVRLSLASLTVDEAAVVGRAIVALVDAPE